MDDEHSVELHKSVLRFASFSRLFKHRVDDMFFSSGALRNLIKDFVDKEVCAIEILHSRRSIIRQSAQVLSIRVETFSEKNQGAPSAQYL